MKLIWIVFLGLAPVANASVLQSKLEAERSIGAQLRSELGAFLPAGSYAIFPSVTIKIKTERQLEKGEVVTRDPGRPSRTVPDLPGFVNNLPDNERKERSERQTFRTVEREEISKVSVRAILDESLPEKLRDTARSALLQKIRESFGNKAKVRVETAALMAARPPSSGGFSPSAFLDFLRRNLFYILGLFALLALLSGALVWLLSRRRPHFSGVERNLTPYEDPIRINPNSEIRSGAYQSPLDLPGRELAALPPANSREFDEVAAEFIDLVTGDPLVARRFLKQLSADEQADIKSCFNATPVQAYFDRIMEIEASVSKREDGVDPDQDLQRKTHVLNDKINALQHFGRLSRMQQEGALGRLALLEPQELQRLFAKREPRQIALALTRMSGNLAKSFLGTLAPNTQREIVKLLAAGFDPREDELKQLSDELGPAIDRESKSLLAEYSESSQLLDAFIESSDHSRELIDAIASIDPKMRNRYRFHLATLDDLVEQGPEMISRVLSNVSNEEIAFALSSVRGEGRERVLESLGQLRRNVVQSLEVAMGSQPSDSEAREATKSIVRSFRQQLRRDFEGAQL